MSRADRLDERLQRGALEFDEAIDLTRLLGSHLDAEHRAGRVDGAIVPSRIVLRHTVPDSTENQGPRLVDPTQDHRDVRAYTAPEAWGGSPTAASDQFAMAAVLYEALCGGRAFPGDDSVRIRKSITTGSRVPLAARVPGLAESIDHVFERALSLDPEARYPDCSTFAEALVSLIERSRGVATDVLVMKPSSKAPQSRRPPSYLTANEPLPFPWVRVAIAMAVLLALAVILGRL